LIERDGVLEHADRQTVGHGYGVQMVGRRNAAGPGHVLDDKRWVPRYVLADEPCQKPPVQIITATHAGWHDHRDLFAFEEIRRRLGHRRSCPDQDDKRRTDKSCLPQLMHSTLSPPSRVATGTTLSERNWNKLRNEGGPQRAAFSRKKNLGEMPDRTACYGLGL